LTCPYCTPVSGERTDEGVCVAQFACDPRDAGIGQEQQPVSFEETAASRLAYRQKALGVLTQRGTMIKTAIVAVVSLCTRRPLSIFFLALILAAGSTVYAVRHFALKTDVKDLVSLNLPWAQRGAQLLRDFPQQHYRCCRRTDIRTRRPSDDQPRCHRKVIFIIVEWMRIARERMKIRLGARIPP
jgi:hypothetical protein